MTAPSPAPEYSPRAFISLAESYGTAAFATVMGPRLLHPAPIGTLAGHCMELSLKAVLLARGATADELRRHGHDLRRLLAASDLDWRDLNDRDVSFFADALREHAFRYIKLERYFLIEQQEESLTTCEAVFHRCLERVMPGAERTLRR